MNAVNQEWFSSWWVSSWNSGKDEKFGIEIGSIAETRKWLLGGLSKFSLRFTWDFKITSDNLIFFRKNVFQPYERARRVGNKNRSPGSLTVTLDFKKILKGPKTDQKSLNLHRGF